MAKNQSQNNAAGLPVVFRVGIALAVAYGAAWAFDNVLQPQNARAPATVSAQDTLRNAIHNVNAKIWR